MIQRTTVKDILIVVAVLRTAGAVIAGGLIASAVVGLMARRITQLARLDA
jgi:hypothetical protein